MRKIGNTINLLEIIFIILKDNYTIYKV